MKFLILVFIFFIGTMYTFFPEDRESEIILIESAVTKTYSEIFNNSQ